MKRKTLQRRARASSLIEVTVALVIISISVGIFMTLYINLLSRSHYLQKLKYELKLQDMYYEMIAKVDFNDDVIDENQIRIFKKVIPYEGNTNLNFIELRAIASDGRLLAECKGLYYDQKR